jgi:parvulin-like peptidyl-prolyl isomerase
MMHTAAYLARRHGNSTRTAAGVIAATLLLSGCAGGPDPAEVGSAPARAKVRDDGILIVEPTPGRSTTVVDARPAALINGGAIAWGELRDGLSEAAGATALREAILDRRLKSLVVEEGLIVDDDDVAREQQVLLDTLSDDPNTAIRLLNELRDRQGLGPVRFQALMRRNAMLRALVQDRVRVTEEAVRRMHESIHGERRQARILTAPDARSAEIALREIRLGDPFGEVAARRSTDVSAARGGLLEPVGRNEPGYPQSLLDAIWSLEEAGDVSSPVLLEEGYAVVQLVEEIPSDGVPLSETREEMERLVRLGQERLLMDRLARRILNDVSVTIFDDSLRDSWTRWQRRQRADS